MMMQGMEDCKGAFHVEYNEFKKMYDFALRCVIRNKRKVQIVLFTLSTLNEDATENEMEEAMNLFTEAVISSLRNVDTGTRYSSNQYLLILMDADRKDCQNIADRVILCFEGNYEKKAQVWKIEFDIQTLTP